MSRVGDDRVVGAGRVRPVQLTEVPKIDVLGIYIYIALFFGPPHLNDT